MDDRQLQTVWRQRQIDRNIAPLAHSISRLVQRDLARQVRQTGKLADAWAELLDDDLLDHTRLLGFSRGVLTVSVDSAAHRFTLQTLLDGGLRSRLQARCPLPIQRVKLVPGRAAEA